MEPDDWYFGHWHIDQGVKEIEGKQFVNIGSLTRGSLNLENIERSPKAVLGVYGKNQRKLTQIKLQVKPASEIFDLKKKARLDQENEKMQQFMEKLRQSSTQTNTESTYTERLKSYSAPVKVMSCVERLMHDAEVALAT